MRDRLADWLGIRPHEVRVVALSACGAFLAIAFAVLARSLREALYLTSFPVSSLPYIIAAVAVLSIPVVTWFARALSGRDPRRVLVRVLAGMAVGIALLWPTVSRSSAAVVAFYLWTDIGTLLVTSGFWLIAAELFPVRGAKRLFGLIGAGGTAGAMAAGNAVALFSSRVGFGALIPGLVVLLGLFWLVQRRLPSRTSPPSSESESRPSLREGWRSAWGHPHLRTIGAIVAVATVASTLVDYQFKEAARAVVGSGEPLAGFFGAFYGWAGAASLVLQVFVTRRLLGGAGVGWTLAILPVALALGSAGLLIVPGLLLATLTRGADTSLRKSFHRSAVELLYVPVPTELRRRTKTVIDSIADNAAEGVGAGIVFLVVTLGGLPSRALSGIVVGLAFTLLWLARRARRHYLATVTQQLRSRAPEAALGSSRSDLVTGELLRGDPTDTIEVAAAAIATGKITAEVLERLEGGGTDEERPEIVAALTDRLGRDDEYHEAVEALAARENRALPHLRSVLEDPGAEFVVRRRIPAVLARFRSAEAEAALLAGLLAPRFEVRYRSAVALVERRQRGADTVPGREQGIWKAIRAEVSRERPVWEYQRLLDDAEPVDDLVASDLGTRGQLSLEHTFRLLSLVLDSDAVASAYAGLTSPDERLESLALEYLEQALPPDVRERLWPFIGDLSDLQRAREARPVEDIVSELVSEDATFIMNVRDREALERRLRGEDEGD